MTYEEGILKILKIYKQTKSYDETEHVEAVIELDRLLREYEDQL